MCIKKVEKSYKDEPIEQVVIKEATPKTEETTALVVENKEQIVVEEEHIITDLTPRPEKSFTLDVSSQTLQMLAEAVAKKISDDITNSAMATRLIEAGGYKRDNEIMAKQIQELLEHNKELSARIEQLESQPARSFWKRIWSHK